MSKELPYFRFHVAEWLNDDVSLEDYEIKGLFIDVCAFYWFKDCSVTTAMLEKRFKDAKKQLEILFELEIIKCSDDSEFVVISFLDTQFDILSKARKRRQSAGSKGGKKKSSNAKAKPKQSSSYKDKDKEKDNYKENDKDKEEKGVIFPFDSDKFKKCWSIWVKYKKQQHRFTYKGDVSEQAALKKLNTLSGHNEEIAIKIIHESIQNGWKGFFELKNTSNGKENQVGNSGVTPEFLAEIHNIINS